MQTVYNLVMIDMDLSYDDHAEEFNIGFFSSRCKAENTAAKYLSEVKGFKDYRVACRITEKQVIGASDSLIQPDVFVIYGWNENDEHDETDVIESDCYLSIWQAQEQLNAMKAKSDRKEWSIDKYRIDMCNWQEGFEKVYHPI